jgi:hypothetical protein
MIVVVQQVVHQRKFIYLVFGVAVVLKQFS